MMRLFTAEIVKIVKSRTTWVLTVLGVLLVGIGSVFFITDDTFTGAYTGTDAQLASLMDQIGGAYIIVLIVGALSVTTEFRHGTIGRTFMLNPSRTAVLGAKLAASAVYALLFTVVGFLSVVGVLAVLGELSGSTFGEQTLRTLAVAPLGLMLAAAFGTAAGALIRSQVLAIAGLMIYALLVETLISQFFPDVSRWLPFSALGGVFSSPETRALIPDGFAVPLPVGTAVTVFVAYVLVVSAISVVLLRFRDV